MKWPLVLLMLAASLAGSLWMLDAMDVIDVGGMAAASLERIPWFEERIAVYRLGEEAQVVIDRMSREIALLQAELAVARRDLERERAQLVSEREALDAQRAELEQRSRQLDAREASLELLARNVADLQRLQRVYAEMRPRDVVPILAELDDAVVARILAGMPSDRTAQILSEMPPDRAARLSKAIGGISTK